MSWLKEIREKKREEGQSMVEFALILPVAMLILCAVIDFGWLFTHELLLSSAVRDGAREGVICSRDRDFETKVRDRVKMEATICSDELVVTPTLENGDVVVEVSYPLEMLTPMAPLVVGGNVYEIHLSCTMKAE